MLELTEKFKKEHCEECSKKDKCQGISVTIDGKLKCIYKNIE